MPSEVVCAIIAACGTVVSALIAWFVSRSAASKEIEKMRLTWDREDLVSSDDEYAEMASLVSTYIHYRNGGSQVKALAKVGALRSKENGPIAEDLDGLYEAIETGTVLRVDEFLTKVINTKRETKRRANSAGRNKPSA